jgi:hypothetical protein
VTASGVSEKRLIEIVLGGETTSQKSRDWTEILSS